MVDQVVVLPTTLTHQTRKSPQVAKGREKEREEGGGGGKKRGVKRIDRVSSRYGENLDETETLIV